MKDKYRKQGKVNFSQYLDNLKEPLDDMSQDIPAGLEAELLENSYHMRRRLRNIAHRMRVQHS